MIDLGDTKSLGEIYGELLDRLRELRVKQSDEHGKQKQDGQMSAPPLQPATGRGDDHAGGQGADGAGGGTVT